MKPNDIKKALKKILELMLYDGDLQRASTISNALDLLNNYEHEIERKDKNYIDLLKTSSARVDIINELQAENERLKEEVALLHTDYTYKFVKENAKAEARKEFAERLMEEATDIGVCDAQGNNYGGATVVFVNDIDNLLKEKGVE